jgi:hypothetical protein
LFDFLNTTKGVVMAINISPRLLAFIEEEYLYMFNKQELEVPLREAHRLDKDAKRKTIERNREINLKKIESLYLDGILKEKDFQAGKVRILNKEKKEKEQLEKENKESLKHLLEGKTNGNFNLFVIKCYYLIRKEKFLQNKSDLKKLSEIENWIINFLKSKKYKKQNSQKRKELYYNLKDIQRITTIFLKGKESQYYEHFTSLIDQQFKNPKPKPIPYPE